MEKSKLNNKKLPNAITRKAIQDIKKGNVIICKDEKDFFEKVNKSWISKKE